MTAPTKKMPPRGKGVGAAGKVTMELWNSHLQAKAGEEVTVLVPNVKRASFLYQRLRSVGFGCEVKVSKMARLIEYPSGGRLEFVITG